MIGNVKTGKKQKTVGAEDGKTKKQKQTTLSFHFSLSPSLFLRLKKN